jgi:hypothetical protein
MTKRDIIKNDSIESEFGLRMVETILEVGWFGHVERRLVDFAVRRVHQMNGNQITGGRGRPRKLLRKI